MQHSDLLLGIAIGDAYAAGLEFQDRDWIRQHVDFSHFINVRDQIQVPPEKRSTFTHHYQAWDYTDDTEMTIGAIKALCSGQELTEALLIQFWEAEYQDGIKGLPSDSKYTAGAVLYLLKSAEDAFDALKKSVYLGGDVDSLASITTGIIAGCLGLDSLPEYMRQAVEGKDYLQKIAATWAL